MHEQAPLGSLLHSGAHAAFFSQVKLIH
jgi:hypothetical protein